MPYALHECRTREPTCRIISRLYLVHAVLQRQAVRRGSRTAASYRWCISPNGALRKQFTLCLRTAMYTFRLQQSRLMATRGLDYRQTHVSERCAGYCDRDKGYSSIRHRLRLSASACGALTHSQCSVAGTLLRSLPCRDPSGFQPGVHFCSMSNC